MLCKLFFLLFISSTLFAAKVPSLYGPVVDEAHMLSSSENATLSTAIKDFYGRYGIQFQIVTIPTLDGEDIASFSIKVADAWKIGSKNDLGIIITLAKEEHDVRIEIGKGLEGDLPDAFTGRVINSLMIPYFKDGLFYSGLAVSLQALSERLGKTISLQGIANTNLNRRNTQSKKLPGNIFFWIIIAIVFIINTFTRRRRGFFGGGFGGFGGSGGGWSGGGGGFSGGGASGRW